MATITIITTTITMSDRNSLLPILYIGAPRACPDILHATRFAASDPVVLLVDGPRLHIVVSVLEAGRAARQIPGADVQTTASLGLEPGAGYAEWALALLRKLGIRKVAVPDTFPLGPAKKIDEGGCDLVIRPARSTRPERLVKTPDELKKLRASQKAAVTGMLAARDLIAAAEIGPRGVLRLDGRPLTAERVRETMRAAILPLGCIDEDTIVACGDQAVDPHEMGHGPLRAGAFVVIDFFPRSLETGYWGDLTRTYWRGELSPEQRRMYETVRKVQAAAKRRILPGADGADVHRFVMDAFAAAGYETGMRDGKAYGFFHGTGHGVGLEIHESPTLGRIQNTLSANMVVTDEPGLYYPGLGGVRIEDTCVVTPRGAVPLATCPVEVCHVPS